MANHVRRFLLHLLEATTPIRTLLQKSSTWYWGASQQASFDQQKSVLGSDVCMAKYDPSYSSTVSDDASSYGLGTVLLQNQPTGERRAVAYLSRSLTSKEQRYSQTEKEALAQTCAVEHFYQFVRGIRFDMETDHHALLTLLGTAELDLIPPCTQDLRMRLMQNTYQMLYVRTKLLTTADTLPGAPLEAATRAHRDPMVDLVELFVNEVVKEFEDFTSACLEGLRRHQTQYEVCTGLLRLCESG
ncbi:MAG: RNase H-like domain-containing protein [Anaplasma sp.]|nr:RNase H-like domain-containing protein [Anaplasma sp.]